MSVSDGASECQVLAQSFKIGCFPCFKVTQLRRKDAPSSLLCCKRVQLRAEIARSLRSQVQLRPVKNLDRRARRFSRNPCKHRASNVNDEPSSSTPATNEDGRFFRSSARNRGQIVLQDMEVRRHVAPASPTPKSMAYASSDEQTVSKTRLPNEIGQVLPGVPCKHCQHDMVLRQNRINGNQFFGCSTFLADLLAGSPSISTSAKTFHFADGSSTLRPPCGGFGRRGEVLSAEVVTGSTRLLLSVTSMEPLQMDKTRSHRCLGGGR